MSNQKEDHWQEVREEMAAEQLAKFKETKHWPYYLECPNCNKETINDKVEPPWICRNCKAEYTEDDLCGECEKLVKGSCYYCKMD